MTSKALKEISKYLKSRTKGFKEIDYKIPSLWIDYSSNKFEDVIINPLKFYSKRIDEILEINTPNKNLKSDLNGGWSSKSSVYNLFVRLTTAYDHNSNGKIDLPENSDGWRETGTFLKTIAILPYIKKFGVNTIHFLPITSIGHDGNKGNLGSPYAIRNPYKIDENLAEPFLDFSIDFQFRALMEATKRMGFRVILEFVFRTASKDSDWIPEHPEWFYWIRNDIELRGINETDAKKYGSPIFTPDKLAEIHKQVEDQQMDNLVEPDEEYQSMFTEIPTKIEYIDKKYIGTTQKGEKCKIPGAFADWPPDDNQPPWLDVTYLRMYNHVKFNYIAYNTIRMYDTRLAKYENKNTPLWEKIINIIPHYQREFDIDGVMIDMGHALPPELLKSIVAKAREVNPYFAFWEENFSLTKRSVEQGYNVTLGYLWCDEYDSEKLNDILKICSTDGFPLPFFATSESHNTPRAIVRKGGLQYSKYSFAINCFLPALIFVHSGYELGVKLPVNTGLDFTNEELKDLPSEILPLFSESMFDWNSTDRIIDFMISLLKIRKKYEELIIDRDPKSFGLIEHPNKKIIAFYRKSLKKNKKVFIIANSNFENKEYAIIKLSDKTISLNNCLDHKKITFNNGIYRNTLNPGEVIILGN